MVPGNMRGVPHREGYGALRGGPGSDCGQFGRGNTLSRDPLSSRDSLASPDPEGPRIEKIQSREAILKKSSFQYRMKFSIGNGFFISGPSLATEKQGLGLKFSIENESFKPRMKISSENENFVAWGNGFFFMRSSENEIFRSPGPLGSFRLSSIELVRARTSVLPPSFLRRDS